MNINPQTGIATCSQCKKKFSNQDLCSKHLLLVHFGGQQSDDEDTNQFGRRLYESSDDYFEGTMKIQNVESQTKNAGSSVGTKRKRKRKQPQPERNVSSGRQRSISKRDRPTDQQSDDEDTNQFGRRLYESSDHYSQDTMKIQNVESQTKKKGSSVGTKRKRKRKQPQPERSVSSGRQRRSKRKRTPRSNSGTSQPRILLKLKVPAQPYKPSDDEDHIPNEDGFLDENVPKKKEKVFTPRVFACDKCPKKFSDALVLTEHKKTHTKMNHKCTYCDERFYNRDFRRTHERHSHKDIVMKHKCTYCPKAFEYPNFLKNHIRTHTGEKPFLCDVCKRGFAERGTMISHRRVHFNDKPYKCHMCDRQFLYNTSLRAHVKAHAKGLRIFKCEPCVKYYKTKKTLRIHRVRFHSEEFLNEAKINAELKRLAPINPPCPLCNKIFKSKRTIRVHTMRLHKVNYDQFMAGKAKDGVSSMVKLGKKFGVDFSNSISAEAGQGQNSGRELSLSEALQSNHAEPSDREGSLSTPNHALEASSEMIDPPKETRQKTKKKTYASKMAGTKDFGQKKKTVKAKKDTKTGKAKSRKSIAVKTEQSTNTAKAKSKKLTKVKVGKSKANGHTETEKAKSKELVEIKTETFDATEYTKTGKAQSKRLTAKKKFHVRPSPSRNEQSRALLDEILDGDLSQHSCSDAEPSQDDVVLFDETQIRVSGEEVILVSTGQDLDD